MAAQLLPALQYGAFVTSFIAVMAGAISAGRMLLHLRKLDLSTYARLGEPAVLSRSGSPLTQKYLWEKHYLQSEHEPVRRWGKRYHVCLIVALASFLTAVVAMALSSMLAI